MDNFKFVDLFSGIGGFNIALTENGGKCIGFSEIEKDAIEFYCKNLNEEESANFGDITKIKELPEHHLLTAGVPCQSWSIAGKNLGFQDDRGQLWNDTIYLLKQSQPKAFIFENVKGLSDPRNKESLNYILGRIKESGYHAKHYVINSKEYNTPQSRVRVYIIGFKSKKYFDLFKLPEQENNTKLSDILNVKIDLKNNDLQFPKQESLFGDVGKSKGRTLSSNNGHNDYFLFNDIRNGDTTIHSWDLTETTSKQKEICYILLKNRRKSKYGCLDGNPLALNHFKEIDSSIEKSEIDELIKLDILKEEEYSFKINKIFEQSLSENENLLIVKSKNGILNIDELKSDKDFKRLKINIKKTIESLKEINAIKCIEYRYDFKNTKISTGLNGINRIILPTSDVFPTMVASDSNDYITTEIVSSNNKDDYKRKFLEKVYKTGKYRKISKKEACLIQGFPESYQLPESRNKWMKLVGNSVSVPVIDILCKAIIETDVFKDS